VGILSCKSKLGIFGIVSDIYDKGRLKEISDAVEFQIVGVFCRIFYCLGVDGFFGGGYSSVLRCFGGG